LVAAWYKQIVSTVLEHVARGVPGNKIIDLFVNKQYVNNINAILTAINPDLIV